MRYEFAGKLDKVTLTVDPTRPRQQTFKKLKEAQRNNLRLSLSEQLVGCSSLE
jgi:hypothetical protein